MDIFKRLQKGLKKLQDFLWIDSVVLIFHTTSKDFFCKTLHFELYNVLKLHMNKNIIFTKNF